MTDDLDDIWPRDGRRFWMEAIDWRLDRAGLPVPHFAVAEQIAGDAELEPIGKPRQAIEPAEPVEPPGLPERLVRHQQDQRGDHAAACLGEGGSRISPTKMARYCAQLTKTHSAVSRTSPKSCGRDARTASWAPCASARMVVTVSRKVAYLPKRVGLIW